MHVYALSFQDGPEIAEIKSGFHLLNSVVTNTGIDFKLGGDFAVVCGNTECDAV